MKTAEILAIGTELLGSTRVDTNSLWLTEQLELLGIEVIAKSCVSDQLEVIVQQIQLALSRADLVISTGGLGPTEDDRSREAVAAALGLTLQEDPAIVAELEAKFKAFGRAMTENNRRQAHIPTGATVFPNPKGTAPGFSLETVGHTAQRMLVFPGPPRELKPMFTDNFFIPNRDATDHVERKVLKVIGLGESAMDERISPIYKALTNPVVTTLFTAYDLEIHLIGRGPEANEVVETVARQMVAELGDHVYSESGESLPEVIGRLLREKDHTLALAESLTGGGVANRVTAVPGASDYFMGSLVTYTEATKVTLLGVPEALLEQHTAVSGPVAEAMARGASERTGATVGLSLTGYAGPTGGTAQDPVGTVYLGLHTPAGTIHKRITLPGDRELIRTRAGEAGLDMVRRYLKETV